MSGGRDRPAEAVDGVMAERWIEYRIRDPEDRTVLDEFTPERGDFWTDVSELEVRQRLDDWKQHLKRRTPSGQPYVERREVRAGDWRRFELPDD